MQDCASLVGLVVSLRSGGDIPRSIDVGGPAGNALAFTADPESHNYAGGLPLDEVASCLSQACGHWRDARARGLS
jgi:cation transport regulator ChaC